MTKYPVHNRRRPNCSRGWSPVLIVNQRLPPCRRVGKRRGQPRFASGVAMGEKREKREKNYNEYFNKPRPIYFERDYAWRFVVCFGPPFF